MNLNLVLYQDETGHPKIKKKEAAFRQPLGVLWFFEELVTADELVS
jgi:hypothetical protein